MWVPTRQKSFSNRKGSTNGYEVPLASGDGRPVCNLASLRDYHVCISITARRPLISSSTFVSHHLPHCFYSVEDWPEEEELDPLVSDSEWWYPTGAVEYLVETVAARHPHATIEGHSRDGKNRGRDKMRLSETIETFGRLAYSALFSMPRTRRFGAAATMRHCAKERFGSRFVGAAAHSCSANERVGCRPGLSGGFRARPMS